MAVPLIDEVVGTVECIVPGRLGAGKALVIYPVMIEESIQISRVIITGQARNRLGTSATEGRVGITYPGRVRCVRVEEQDIQIAAACTPIEVVLVAASETVFIGFAEVRSEHIVRSAVEILERAHPAVTDGLYLDLAVFDFW